MTQARKLPILRSLPVLRSTYVFRLKHRRSPSTGDRLNPRLDLRVSGRSCSIVDHSMVYVTASCHRWLSAGPPADLNGDCACAAGRRETIHRRSGASERDSARRRYVGGPISRNERPIVEPCISMLALIRVQQSISEDKEKIQQFAYAIEHGMAMPYYS